METEPKKSRAEHSEDVMRFRRRGQVVWTTVLFALMLYGLFQRAPEAVDGPDATVYVDPNSAPLHVLEALPGIGPVLGRRIIDARGDGRFEAPEDLDVRIKGIGPAKVRTIRPFLRFDGESGPKSQAD